MDQVTPLFAKRLLPFAKRKRIVEALTEPECPTFWGYCRVSDPKQAGNTSTETQPADIRRVYEEKWKATHDLGEIVADVASASKILFRDRPEGKYLLSKMKKGDVLAVTKVDRFSRSMRHGLMEVGDLVDRGIRVLFLNMGGADITFDGTNGFLLMSFLFVAEQESKIRSQRAKEALARIKLTGRTKSGRVYKKVVKYGTRPVQGKRVPAPEWRQFVRSLLALYTFAVEEFHYTKCDIRHQWLAETYGLLWWTGYSTKGPDGPKTAIPADVYLRWFQRETEAQAKEEVKHQVDEPWRRDFEAGKLRPVPHPGYAEWRVPINSIPHEGTLCPN